jgi:hypothetical protein
MHNNAAITFCQDFIKALDFGFWISDCGIQNTKKEKMRRGGDVGEILTFAAQCCFYAA